MSATTASAVPTTATPSPWGSTAAPKSPTLQEILDEELARQLTELELHQATAEVHADYDLAKALALEEVAAVQAEIEEDEDSDEEHDDDEDEEDADDDYYDDEDDDYFDEADDVHDEYTAKNVKTRGMGVRRRTDDPLKLQLAGSFDERTRFVLGKLAARGILSAVDSRLHSSTTALLHHASNMVAVEDSDEKSQVHYAVKMLKASAIDHSAHKTSESLQRSNRPVNEDMLWMSVRRQLKIQMDREYTSLARAVASGVRAPAPVCSWEHVMVMGFVGNETKAAPRLRDVKLNQGQLAQAFVDLVSSMRSMYQQAKLVHGGLNEYSILYHNDACWITDFSGAIDISHAEHTEALERDIGFVHDFFASSGMPKASKHSIGMLHESTMRALITEEAPSQVLGAFPWLKPFLYGKK